MELYRALLRLYPAEFREEYARELCLVLEDRRREQRSRAGLLLVWLHAVWGVLKEAPKEHCHVIFQDLRYAVRILRKDPLAPVSAIVILALGIGSTTVVFSLANGLFLRPFAYPRPDRLVAVQECRPGSSGFGGNVAFPNYRDMRARSRLLEDIGVYTEGSVALRGEGEAEQVPSVRMSDGVFRILGVEPLLGRVFTAAEDLPNGAKVVVLSQELWQRRYGGDPGILGRTLELGNSIHTVIGVMPAGFHYPSVAELWTPLQMAERASRTDYFLEGVARLRPGVTVEQASEELRSMMLQINRENPVTDSGNTARAVLLRESVVGELREAVITLLVAVGFLLLIACANVSNLLLVKASARTREMAVRTAIGATRRRLIRQLVSESVLLGVAGGVAGLALAYAGIPAMLSLVPSDRPRWVDFSIDHRVLLFAFGVSLLTSIVFGIVPAFSASSVDVTRALKEAHRGGSTGLRQKFLRNGLVIAEVTLSLMLLAGAGLMIRSFLALRTQHLGYRTENVLTMVISPPGSRYPSGPQARALLGRLKSEVESLPGVTSLAFASGVPLANSWGRSLTVEGHPVLSVKDAPTIFYVVTTPAYFRTLGIPLLEGRDFAETDFENPAVTIIAASIARKYWPGERAIGKRVRYGPPENNEPWHTIVGVAADAKNEKLIDQNRPGVYLPYSNRYTPTSLMIRTSSDPMPLAQAVKGRITGVDRSIAVSRIRSLEQVVDFEASPARFFTVLFAVFAGLATTLAAVGLYAVLAYTVSLRTHEIGIRMALGASAAELRGMVMRQGLTLAGAGLLVGIGAALALTRLLRSQLYHTSPMDPGTYGAVVLLMLLVALLAAFLPARRATRVDPVIALRQE